MRTALDTGDRRSTRATRERSRPPRVAVSLGAGVALVPLLILALALSGCSLSGPFFDDSYERSQMLSPEPVPPYRKLVAAAARRLSSPIGPDGLQISAPRWIDRVGGPAWIVCLKAAPEASSPLYYAFFIQKETIVDTRTAIGTDRCVHQDFLPFDIAAN